MYYGSVLLVVASCSTGLRRIPAGITAVTVQYSATLGWYMYMYYNDIVICMY